MRIAIIDADLIGRKKHRFPNLACMKISGYHKEQGDEVSLVLSYDGLDEYDRVFLSKVFTDTDVPEPVLTLPNLSYGGTGFYYDKAPKLPTEIEHHMPDYHLYDAWVKEQIADGKKPREFSYYTDYSIGFLTRGCFRQCPFCVNQNYKKVETHSPLSEFLDLERPKICLLDDNFFGSAKWSELMSELRSTHKPFQFNQGLDERLLTPDRCEALFSSRYDGDFTFAFDHLADAELIQRKISMAREYTNAILKFYCFTGFDRSDKWDAEFWYRDIFDLFTRIEILMRNRCLPYVMRFNRYNESSYRGVYVSVARWCNQPSLYKKKSLREFAELNGVDSACYKYLADFEKQFPEAGYFYDLKFEKAT